MSKSLCKLITSLVIGAMTITTSTGLNAMASSGPSSSGDSEYKTPYTWSRAKTGAGGGFIPAVIYNESEEGLVYTRTDMGGAYRLDKETQTWIPLTDWISFDDWNYLGVESLATDPVETNRVYLAAGTYTNDWGGNGAILRSKDKGETWEKTELPFKIGGNMPGRSMGERLVIDPNANNVLYLGTHNQGLWKSEDYGETWNKVEGFTAEGNYIDPNFNDQTGVVWVTFDKTSGGNGTASQTIYAGIADTTESIYRSTDGGKTWSPVEGQPTKENQSSWSEGFLPHHASLTSNGDLYITYSNTCGPYDGSKGAVWKYNTKTNKWTDISPIATSSSDDYFGYGGLAVDAQNPNTLVVSCLNSWWPDTNFYRSTDGGETWTPFWEWSGYPSRTLRYNQDISKAPWLDFGANPAYPEPALKLGWMVGGISIDPFDSNKMVYGTGATMYGTDNLTNMDKGEKIDITVKANGIEEESVSTVISPSDGPHLLSGMGDVCGFAHEDLTQTPKSIFTTPNTNTASMDFAEESPNFIVRVGNVTDDDKATKKSCAFSYNAGGNWFTGKDIDGIKGDAGGTVAVAPDGKTVVWAPSGSGTTKAYYTTNNGSSWTECSGLPEGAKVSSDRVNSSKFYGFVNGEFYLSEDAGKTFTKTEATGLPTSGTRKVKAATGREGEIWIVGGSTGEGNYGMWHSTDSGKTFVKLENVEQADTVGFGKAKEDGGYPAIYTYAKINGVRGIFRSDDEGENWIRLNDDEHQFGCANSDISGDPRVYGRVYVATNGLGVVYGDINNDVEQPTTPDKTKLGDVNGDGKISSVDFIYLKKYLSGTTVTINEKKSDINGDGSINVLDLVALKKML